MGIFDVYRGFEGSVNKMVNAVRHDIDIGFALKMKLEGLGYA
jgi:hypothetical protein